MELLQFEVRILKSMERRLSGFGLSCLPVNEQELGQTAQQVTQRQSYPSWSLQCFVECPRAPFKWPGLRKGYPLGSPPPLFANAEMLPHKIATCRTQRKASSPLGKRLSKDGLGNPGSPWGLRGQNYFHKNTETLVDLFTLVLSQVHSRVFQKIHDLG